MLRNSVKRGLREDTASRTSILFASGRGELCFELLLTAAVEDVGIANLSLIPEMFDLYWRWKVISDDRCSVQYFVYACRTNYRMELLFRAAEMVCASAKSTIALSLTTVCSGTFPSFAGSDAETFLSECVNRGLERSAGEVLAYLLALAETDGSTDGLWSVLGRVAESKPPNGKALLCYTACERVWRQLGMRNSVLLYVALLCIVRNERSCPGPDDRGPSDGKMANIGRPDRASLPPPPCWRGVGCPGCTVPPSGRTGDGYGSRTDESADPYRGLAADVRAWIGTAYGTNNLGTPLIRAVRMRMLASSGNWKRSAESECPKRQEHCWSHLPPRRPQILPYAAELEDDVLDRESTVLASVPGDIRHKPVSYFAREKATGRPVFVKGPYARDEVYLGQLAASAMRELLGMTTFRVRRKILAPSESTARRLDCCWHGPASFILADDIAGYEKCTLLVVKNGSAPPTAVVNLSKAPFARPLTAGLLSELILRYGCTGWFLPELVRCAVLRWAMGCTNCSVNNYMVDSRERKVYAVNEGNLMGRPSVILSGCGAKQTLFAAAAWNVLDVTLEVWKNVLRQRSTAFSQFVLGNIEKLDRELFEKLLIA